MRWVTYIDVVLRRLWARKLMLLGSFLGATLVTALLVVLPLYEASVQAVDLLFTFRQAPDSVVDIEAAQTTTDYDPAEAVTAREAFAELAGPLRTWYSAPAERLLTREMVFIPIATPDWLGAAEEWREAVAAGEASPSAAPYPRPAREATQSRMVTAPDIVDHVRLIEGDLVVDIRPEDAEEPLLPIALGPNVARLTALGVGDRVILKPFASTADVFEIAEVTAIFEPLDPTDDLWRAVRPDELILVPPETLDAWSGSFSADPDVDPWLRDRRGFQRLTVAQSFTMSLDREAVTLDNVNDLVSGVETFALSIGRAEGFRTITALDDLVAEFDTRTVVFGAPILAMLALVVAGALYFLVYMSALALEREADELAMLRMRGASSFQTAGIHIMQSALIAIGAVLLAPIVARAMVAVTGRIPPMSTLTGGEALSVVEGRSILPFALSGGLLTFAMMGLAILPFARKGVLELRSLASRPARVSVWQRYYLDVFLVAFAGFVLFELGREGLVTTEVAEGEQGLDPFTIAGPALFLFAGSLLLLRVLPWALRGLGWLMTRVRGMSAALPGWHLGRNPIPYGRLALLVWLTTGFAVFALSYAATLERSFDDRAFYEAGTDLRVIGDRAGFIGDLDGAETAQVFRGSGAIRLSGAIAELVAVDPSEISDVVFWRDDFASEPLDAIFSEERMGGEWDLGVELPDGVTELRMEAVVVPPPWARRVDDGPTPPVRVMARVVDERSRLRTFAAEQAVTDEEWSTVSISLDPGTARERPMEPAESLTLQALWIETDASGAAALEPTVFLVDDIRAVSGDVESDIDARVYDELAQDGGLSLSSVPGDHATEQFYSAIPSGESAPSASEIASSPLTRDGEVRSWRVPGRTRAQAVPHLGSVPEPLPFIADRQAAAQAGVSVGETTIFGVEGVAIDGTLVGQVELFPTMLDRRRQGTLITRYDGLMEWLDGDPSWSLTGNIASRHEPQELWVSTDDVDAAVSIVQASADGDVEIVTAAGVAADFSSRPIQVGLVSILFLGTGAGVVLALAGVTAYVVVAVRKRYREMGVLRALGLRRSSVAGTFAVEQLVVLGLGAAIGVVAGLILMRIMIPFLQLGENAVDIQPPALMVVEPKTLAIYLAVVVLLLIGSVLWATRSVSARRLSEVLREVER